MKIKFFYFFRNLRNLDKKRKYSSGRAAQQKVRPAWPVSLLWWGPFRGLLDTKSWFRSFTTQNLKRLCVDIDPCKKMYSHIAQHTCHTRNSVLFPGLYYLFYIWSVMVCPEFVRTRTDNCSEEKINFLVEKWWCT
jgi:hypothetical protein